MGASGQLKVEEALAGVTRLGLDTSPLIYYIEESEVYKSALEFVFGQVIAGEVEAFTSVVTITEVLVQPLLQKDQEMAERYREILLQSDHLHVIPITERIAQKAAQLRADYTLRTPDALQLSASVEVGCDIFLTNDAALKRVSEIRVVTLSDFEDKSPE
jgi:predicted nucleic acid-binding protein